MTDKAETASSPLRVAGALIGAFVGMLALQLLALPVLLLLFGVFRGLQHVIGRLDGAAQITWNLTVIFSMLGVILLATVAGLVAGWGVGARMVAGASVAHALAGSRIFGWLRSASSD